MIASSTGGILGTSAMRFATARCSPPPVPLSPMTRNRTEPSFLGSSNRSWRTAGAVKISNRTMVEIARRTGSPPPGLSDRVRDEVHDQVGVGVDQDHGPVDEAVLQILGQLR